ncbi:MAG TPA: hypothetical protein VHL34_13730 [Rhizomicrobium sp.]|jgi:hypothetical protein|nr:hypothetical protein [Rhizomicrobium sp.]
MTQDEIDAVLNRVRSWPKERQEDLVGWINALEDLDEGDYELTEEERADLDAAEEEVRRGEIATDEQVKALLDRYR